MQLPWNSKTIYLQARFLHHRDPQCSFGCSLWRLLVNSYESISHYLHAKFQLHRLYFLGYCLTEKVLFIHSPNHPLSSIWDHRVRNNFHDTLTAFLHKRYVKDHKRKRCSSDIPTTSDNIHFAIMLSPSPMTNLKKMKLLKCSTYIHTLALRRKHKKYKTTQKQRKIICMNKFIYCTAIAHHGTDYKITCVCLTVVVPTVRIFTWLWRNSTPSFGAHKLRSSSPGVKIRLTLFLFCTTFHPHNACSMGRSDQSNNKARGSWILQRHNGKMAMEEWQWNGGNWAWHCKEWSKMVAQNVSHQQETGSCQQ